MSYFTDHMAEVLIVAGLIMMVVEIAIIGFATFVLFFLGLASLLTGGLMMANIIPETWAVASASCGILTAGLTLVLWSPLKKLQSQQDNRQVHQDFNDHRFVLADDVDHQGLVSYSYSGIDWKLKSDQLLTSGTEVHIVRSEVGVLWVAAINTEDQSR